MNNTTNKVNRERVSTMMSEQLQSEYIAYHTYNSISAYFKGCGNEYLGLSTAFKKMANEELEHADGIIQFMNRRDFEISYLNIEVADPKGNTCLELTNKCIELEENVLKHLNKIYNNADKEKDFATTVFLDPYLEEQLHSIKELNWYRKNLESCTDDFKLRYFDSEVARRAGGN